MYRVGVDLGGTNIVAGVVDEYYRIVGRGIMQTARHRSANDILDDIATAVNKAVEDANISLDDVLSIGIGTPGSVNKKYGIIEYANNLEFDNVPCNNVDDFIAITLGTGVGTGIVVGGKILNGCNDAGGEMGHMVIVADGEPCTCGRNGCWEAYSSATALIRETKKAMLEDKDSKMWELVDGDIENTNGRTSFDAMRAGDETAKKVVDNYIHYLAIGVTNIINIFQPSVLCIGGGIGNEKENILEPLRKIVEKERYSVHCSEQTRICSARLGNDAGVIGAALLDE